MIASLHRGIFGLSFEFFNFVLIVNLQQFAAITKCSVLMFFSVIFGTYIEESIVFDLF